MMLSYTYLRNLNIIKKHLLKAQTFKLSMPPIDLFSLSYTFGNFNVEHEINVSPNKFIFPRPFPVHF